jgi:hypothetical protein
VGGTPTANVLQYPPSLSFPHKGGGDDAARAAPSLRPEHAVADFEGFVGAVVNELMVFVVVRAASHEEAARLFENHPHFTIFPCDGVDVMPLLGLTLRGLSVFSGLTTAAYSSSS